MLAVSAIILPVCAANADDYVHGYTRSNGTYVEPYYKSSPNNSTFDNYSTKGNVNPYTGQEGTKNPYGSTNSTYGLYGSQQQGYGSKRW
ncbi:hypothetical protein [Hyphomicrobium sp. 99]|uniref:hypothetical protein n=1 Tax=Hyphomicrobium sp. 99 TaxID=1163419 RepID=UPI0018CE0343|nr:hypothetical protein [Hyphomicrobium sp. 99]